jgi:hypothetical protein
VQQILKFLKEKSKIYIIVMNESRKWKKGKGKIATQFLGKPQVGNGSSQYHFQSIT